MRSVQPGAVRRSRAAASSIARRSAAPSRSRRPMTSSRTPLATQRAVSSRRYSRKSRISQPTSVRGPAPVVGREGEQREHADPAVGRGLDDPAHHRRAGPVAGRARAPLPRGPAAVAVHDDPDVDRRRRGGCEVLCCIKLLLKKREALSARGWRGSALPCGPGSARARAGRRRSGGTRSAGPGPRTSWCRRRSRPPRACARGR